MAKGDLFQCDICGGVFAKGRSDEEAMAEVERDMGPDPDGSGLHGVLCDECYESFLKWWKSGGEAKYRRSC
jgi:hypothetical protein